MTLHFHRYIEIPAPLTHTRDLLCASPPLDAVRLGGYWRWLDDLWAFELHAFDDDRLIWRGESPALSGSSLFLSIALRDATIVTHATIHLAVDLPCSWLSHGRARRRVVESLEHGMAEVRDRTLAIAPPPVAPDELPADPSTLAESLRATHPATVAAFEAMDALSSLAAVAALDRRWRATEAGAVPDDVYAWCESPPALDGAFDLIYAGGGLGLLHAAVMAQRYGRRVLLFDRGEVGCAHREWNISDGELRALIDIGLFDRDELESVIMRRYRDGVVRFWPGGSSVRPAELRMRDVLNVSIDAGALLRLTRRKLEQAGGTVLDRRSFGCVLFQRPGRVVVEVRREDGAIERYGARLLLDAMGATSPLALRRFAGQPFAGVCPTVGTVVAGLEPGTAPWQHNPNQGDILISVTDAQRGRQLIWEGFAGRDDELTVYVFYYDLLRTMDRGRWTTDHGPRTMDHGPRTTDHGRWTTDDGPRTMDHGPRTTDHGPRTTDHGLRTMIHSLSMVRRLSSMVRRLSSIVYRPSSIIHRPSSSLQRHSLLDLFEDYFTLLPTYKRPGPNFRHIKPVYGFIPARHTQRRQTVPLLPGVLPIGDSSAQQSPLTFCGFGSFVRNLDRTTSLLDYAFRHDLLAPEHLSHVTAYQANVALNWVFSRFMQPWGRPDDVNRLQNIFARVLNELGVEVAVRFFKDQMTWRDYGRIVNHTLAIYKPIIPTALAVLGPRDCARWFADWLRFSGSALIAAGGRAAGDQRLAALEPRLESLAPALALRLMARRAEWWAMGWDHGRRTTDDGRRTTDDGR